MTTDLADLRSKLDLHGSSVLGVVSCTSCFAPRVPDRVDVIAKMVEEYEGVGHIVNNAYGLQDEKAR